MDNLNSLFVELTSNYLETSNLLIQYFNIPNSNSNQNPDTNPIQILDNNIMQVEASINDLLINLQNLKFSLESVLDKPILNKSGSGLGSGSGSGSGSYNIPPLKPEMDKLINKAIKEMMPMMMVHLMRIDPDSILNKPVPNDTKLSGPYDVD
jgi:hypothetical protein